MLSYIGGKSRIGTWINEYIPKDIKTYVEPFGGMFWVYFKSDVINFDSIDDIVYNDFNPLNVNLFKCVSKEHYNLFDIVNATPVQRRNETPTPDVYKKLFNKFQGEIFSEEFEFPKGELDYEHHQIAMKYAYVLSQVFSGSKPSKSKFIDLKGKYKSKFLTFRDKLVNPKWTSKFDAITEVENMDFEKLIDTYDSDSSFFYIDPPYWKTENYYSNHDFDTSDHKRLAERLQRDKLSGRFALSYYDFPELHEMYPETEFNWYSKDFAKAAGAAKGKKQSKGTEILITNY